MKRAEILDAAKKCVVGDREQDYGSPENNFNTIAGMWDLYLHRRGFVTELGAADVAAMLALLKIARIGSGHAKEDNWIDLAGYAACGGELQGREFVPSGKSILPSAFQQHPPTFEELDATQTSAQTQLPPDPLCNEEAFLARRKLTEDRH